VVVPGVVDYTEEADAAVERFRDAGRHVVRWTRSRAGCELRHSEGRLWPALAVVRVAVL
jgi:hypothetical protein